MENTNVVIAIDDVHPEKDWGVEGDVQIEYLKSLNEKFGCKFNLFIPSNYHGHFPISKDFIDFRVITYQGDKEDFPNAKVVITWLDWVADMGKSKT